MPSPEEVAYFALHLAREAARELESFVQRDPDLAQAAEMALLAQREPAEVGDGTTWPGGPSRWSEYQAALDLLVGLATLDVEEKDDDPADPAVLRQQAGQGDQLAEWALEVVEEVSRKDDADRDA